MSPITLWLAWACGAGWIRPWILTNAVTWWFLHGRDRVLAQFAALLVRQRHGAWRGAALFMDVSNPRGRYAVHRLHGPT
jgi:hypothetical protein